MLKSKNKNKENKIQYEPWNEKETSVMKLSINQTKLKRDTQLAEIASLEMDLKDINIEIKANLAKAIYDVKLAKMALAGVEFDIRNKIMIHTLECKMGELIDEAARAEINIQAFETQLKQGKPKQEVDTMSEEPKIDDALKEKTPEEKPKDEPEADASDNPEDIEKAEKNKDSATTDEKSPKEDGGGEEPE